MEAQEIMIRLAGAAHFGILLASALVPRVLDWRRQLRSLSALSRHLVWVHGAFIVLVIVAFGTICLLNASDLTAGSPLARTVCTIIAVFWGARLVVQIFLFDARPYLDRRSLRLGYHGLTAVFTFITFVLAWAALAPASPVT